MPLSRTPRRFLSHALALVVLLYAPALSRGENAAFTAGEGIVADRQEVAPGVSYHSEQFDLGPVLFHVLGIDTTKSKVQFETRSGLNRVGDEGLAPDLSTVEEIAEREESASVLAAINGDFWNEATGKPLGTMVESGAPRRVISGRAGVLFGFENQIHISVLRPVIEMRRAREITKIPAFNRAPPKGAVAVVTDPSVAVSLLEEGTSVHGVIGIGDDFANRWQSGLLHQRESGSILLAGDRHKVFIAALERGGNDESRIEIRTRFPSVEWPIKSALGGGPVLLTKGRPLSEETLKRYSSSIAPRTAVATDATGKQVWLVVVDGRRPGYSLGVTLGNLADYLVSLGATEALNLDGGGSSTIWVKGEVRNRPSDLTGARGVTNALLLTRRESPTAQAEK